ncbi:MAG: metallophosphoesterase [Lentimicrobiaceae bacterium]|jgi:predicted MPP superfamily phosphohydrolase|nr:metallophosphoesterase [Lentimicrobiaceae bacterium]
MRSPFFFILMLLVYSLASFYVLFRFWQALPNIKVVKIIYIVLAVLITYLYLFSVLLHHDVPLSLSRVIENVGSIWFIFLLYALMAFILIDLVRLINCFFRFLPNIQSIGVFRTWQVVAMSVVGVITIVFLIGYVNFRNIDIYEIDITLQQKSPDAKQELNIVVASDLHLGNTIRKKTTQRFVEKINSLNPDIVLFAGDVINSDMRPVEALQLDEELKKLQAPMGVYAVLGNHEYISRDVAAVTHFFKKANIVLLRDNVLVIDKQLTLIGRDDRSNQSRKPLHELVAQTKNDLPILLIDHQPYNLDEAVENNVTLMVSGHTHNGQVWPITWIVENMYELAHGYMQKGNSHFYVSSGLGLWGPLLRIGSKSEIGLIRLRFAEN